MTHKASEFHPRVPMPRILGALICAAAGMAVFQFLGNSTRGYIGTNSLFVWWGVQWINPDSETQHGLLILGISIWLLIRNGKANLSESRDANYLIPAAAAMFAGMLMHTLGFIAEQTRISILGMLVFAWGIAAFAGGERWARAATFPLAFMVFAIPLSALDSAGFWLRMWVVESSTWIVHGLGINILTNGTQLLSQDGRYDYDVAAACSGVRSLVALAALSLLMGYLYFKPFWARMAILALCFPLVFVGNVVRIVAIIVAAQIGGQIWGDRIHETMGFGVFAIVLGGLYSIAEIAARLRPGWTIQAPSMVSPATSNGAESTGFSDADGRRYWTATVVSTLGVAIFAIFLIHISARTPRGGSGVALKKGGLAPVDLPVFIGTDWMGRRTEVTETEKQVLPPDTGFSRKLYVSISDPSIQVFLSIVLSGRDRTSIHRPELCLVGQGWTIRSSFVHEFERPGGSGTFPSTVLRVEKELSSPSGRMVVPQLVAYYFVSGDAVVASHWDRLFKDAWNRVAHGRADRWAYVLIQTGDSDGETNALQRIQTILNGTIPTFQKAG
jgi:EpsI family protein